MSHPPASYNLVQKSASIPSKTFLGTEPVSGGAQRMRVRNCGPNTCTFVHLNGGGLAALPQSLASHSPKNLVGRVPVPRALAHMKHLRGGFISGGVCKWEGGFTNIPEYLRISRAIYTEKNTSTRSRTHIPHPPSTHDKGFSRIRGPEPTHPPTGGGTLGPKNYVLRAEMQRTLRGGGGTESSQSPPTPLPPVPPA